MSNQAGLDLLESQEEQPKAIAVRELPLDFSSPPARSLTATTRSEVSEQPRTVKGARRLRIAQRRVAELREKVVSNRLRLKEKRNELREERTRASDLDARFIRAIRQSWEHDQTVDKESLVGLYQEVQAARDLLGPMEDDYNQEEDSNDAAEFQLNDQEKRFYRLYHAIVSSGGASTEDGRSVSSSLSSLNSLNGGLAPNRKAREPGLEEYESRVGDANIVKERLENLRREREQYLEEGRLRDRVNLDLYPPNRAFLEEYDQNYTELKEELDYIIADARRLRHNGFEQGVPVAELPSPAVPSLHPDTSSKLEDQHRSVYNDSPALFTEHQSDGVVPDLRVDFAGTMARINRWILDTLNNSPVERAHHKAILMALSDQDLDNEAWARLVFKYWRRDQAAVSQLGNSPLNEGTYGANIERQDLTPWSPQSQRFYTEGTSSEDRQLYAGGNPLLASKVDAYIDVDTVSRPDTQPSESDLYTSFLKSQSV